jgi:hypothetical protein
METAHEPLNLHKWSLVQWKVMDIQTKFIWIIPLFEEAFQYGDGVKFWGQTLNHSVEFCNFMEGYTFAKYLNYVRFQVLTAASMMFRIDNSEHHT